jgi:hypothetical protein
LAKRRFKLSRMTRLLAAFLAFTFFACELWSAEKPPSTVTRKEAIATAERYLRMVWTPSPRNIFHGKDQRGIRVDTPDAAYHPANSRAGWWQADRANVGMPYKWGGFDTPLTFTAGLRQGRAAGDIYTVEKRRLLEAGVSDAAVGIDCSGLISRCWKLPVSYSTRTLQQLCDAIETAQLRAGDILNTENGHVLLFAEWANPERSRLRAYEAGSPPTWKVLLNEMGTQWLVHQGYKPFRYRGIRE